MGQMWNKYVFLGAMCPCLLYELLCCEPRANATVSG